MISAPSTSPSLTFWIASARLSTCTGSIASNSRWPSFGEVDLAAAQLDRRRPARAGRCRTPPRACPARARGRSRSAPRSRSGRARAGHQQRRAAQDAQVLERAASASVALAGAGTARRPPRSRARSRRVACSSSRGGAVEELLAVGQHDQLVRVAVGLLDVVGGVEDRRALAGEAQDELPEALALARVERRARLVEQQHLGLRPAGRSRCSLAGGCRPRACPPGRRPGRPGRSARACGRRCRAGPGRARAARTARGSPPPSASVERRLLRAPSRSRRRPRRAPRPAPGCPARIESSVVLPAPLGPITATSSPRPARQRHAAQRLALAEALDQVARRDGRGAWPSPPRAAWQNRPR